MRFIDPPDGRPWALLVLCGGSLVLNLVLATRLWMLDPSQPEAVEVAVAPAGDAVEVAVAAVPDVPIPPVELPTPVAPVDEGLFHVHAPVEHSLARTFQNASPERADVLSAIYARLFVWDLDLRRDLQRGDEVKMAYTWDGELAEIPVASYRSGKLGRTLKAYRFHAKGDRFASWWDETGTEVPRRLQDGPLREYEQVTSLLKDRPRHKGMDFKVPEGTEVLTPRSGTVTRADWNLAFNGNCVEVRYDDGTLARFLHLSDTQVSSGQRLAAGAVVGLSGNTGRSTAPHLHYELEKAGKVVDPVTYHGVIQRTLDAEDLQAFQASLAGLEQALDAPS